jgi:hypothetical protein
VVTARALPFQEASMAPCCAIRSCYFCLKCLATTWVSFFSCEKETHGNEMWWNRLCLACEQFRWLHVEIQQKVSEVAWFRLRVVARISQGNMTQSVFTAIPFPPRFEETWKGFPYEEISDSRSLFVSVLTNYWVRCKSGRRIRGKKYFYHSLFDILLACQRLCSSFSDLSPKIWKLTTWSRPRIFHLQMQISRRFRNFYYFSSFDPLTATGVTASKFEKFKKNKNRV